MRFRLHLQNVVRPLVENRFLLSLGISAACGIVLTSRFSLNTANPFLRLIAIRSQTEQCWTNLWKAHSQEPGAGEACLRSGAVRNHPASAALLCRPLAVHARRAFARARKANVAGTGSSVHCPQKCRDNTTGVACAARRASRRLRSAPHHRYDTLG